MVEPEAIPEYWDNRAWDPVFQELRELGLTVYLGKTSATVITHRVHRGQRVPIVVCYLLAATPVLVRVEWLLPTRKRDVLRAIELRNAIVDALPDIRISPRYWKALVALRPYHGWLAQHPWALYPNPVSVTVTRESETHKDRRIYQLRAEIRFTGTQWRLETYYVLAQTSLTYGPDVGRVFRGSLHECLHTMRMRFLHA